MSILRHPLRSWLFLAVLLPVVATAATAATYRDIVKIVQQNTQPLQFSLDLSGTYGENRGSIVIEGTENGQLNSLAKAAMDASVIADITLEENIKGHAKVLVRLVEKTLYLQLDEFTINDDAFALEKELAPYMNVWIKIPVEENEYEEYVDTRRAKRLSDSKKFDQYFIVTKENTNNRVRYTITINPTKKRALITEMVSVTRGYSPRMRAELRKLARTMTLTLESSVQTQPNGTLETADSTLMISLKQDGKPMKFTLKGNLQTQREQPVIQAPSESKTLEELGN